MAHQTPGGMYSIEASTDLSANQHRFLINNSSEQAAVAGAGVAVIGVQQDNNADLQGKATAYMADGLSKLVAGAAVTANAEVASDATGRGVTAATGNRVAGIAITGAAGAGELFTVLLVRGGQLN